MGAREDWVIHNSAPAGTIQGLDACIAQRGCRTHHRDAILYHAGSARLRDAAVAIAFRRSPHLCVAWEDTLRSEAGSGCFYLRLQVSKEQRHGCCEIMPDHNLCKLVSGLVSMDAFQVRYRVS